MQIVPPNIDHAEYISNELANYFSNANIGFGYPKYKDDRELMHKHITKRLSSEDSGHTYFIAEDDNGNSLGFVNLMIDEFESGSITMIIGEDENIRKLLFEYSLTYFKNMQIKRVQLEVLFNDTTITKLLEGLDSEAILTRYRINLS